MWGRRCTLLFGALLTAATAQASLEFTAVFNGTPVPGSEVCFYKTGGFDNPLVDLTATSFQCLAADTVLDVPAGSFAYFMRNVEQRLVSAHQGLLTLPTAPPPEAYRLIRWPLVPGVLLHVSEATANFQERDHLVLVVGATQTNRPSVIPVPVGTRTVLVPADVPIVPVWMRDGTPLQVGTRASYTNDDEPAHLDTFPAVSGVSLLAQAVVEEVNKPPSTGSCELPFSDDFLTILEKIPPPIITVEIGGQTFEPVLPVVHSPNLNPTILIFANLPGGKARLTLRGDIWTPYENLVELTPPVTLAAEPLVTRVAASVKVAWSVPRGVLETRQECDQEPPGGHAEIKLSRCNRTVCNDVKSVAIDVAGERGTVSFDGVGPGAYRVSLRSQDVRWARRETTVELGQRTRVALEPEGITPIWGVVTRNGAPVHAKLKFYRGTTVSSATTGEYYIPLTTPPGRTPVRVTACDGSVEYVYSPGEARIESPLHIEIPANFITIRVVSNGTPAKDVIVRFYAQNPEQIPGGVQETLYSLTGTTDERGESRLGPLPLGTIGMACVYSPRKCSDELTIKRPEAVVTISLGTPEPEGVVSPVGYHRIFFLSVTGEVIDARPIAPDGRFTYNKDKIGPLVVLVAQALPLYVGSITPASKLRVDVPAAPARSFRFHLGRALTQQNALVALVVNGIRIPTSAMVAHQGFRGQPHLILDRQPLRVDDVLGTGPIAVIVGPDPQLLTIGVPQGADPMGMVEVLSAARVYPITSDGDVILGALDY